MAACHKRFTVALWGPKEITLIRCGIRFVGRCKILHLYGPSRTPVPTKRIQSPLIILKIRGTLNPAEQARHQPAPKSQNRERCLQLAVWASPPPCGTKKRPDARRRAFFLVPVVGLEPTRCRHQRILSPSRLPIPSHRRMRFIRNGYIVAHLFSKVKYLCGKISGRTHIPAGICVPSLIRGIADDRLRFNPRASYATTVKSTLNSAANSSMTMPTKSIGRLKGLRSLSFSCR